MKMHVILASLLCLAAAASAHGRDAYVKMWSGEKMLPLLPANAGWWAYRGQKDQGYRSSPGLMRTFNYSGKGPLPEPYLLRVPLEKELPAGTYMIYVRNFHMGGKMEVTLGHESKFVKVPRFEWSSGAPFEVDPAQKTADAIQLKLYPTMVEDSGSAQVQSYIVQGVFITTDLKKIPRGDGEILELSPLVAPASRAGNYLEGASFESGLGHGWGKPAGMTYIVDAGNLDNATAADGQYSLRLPLAASAAPNGKPRMPFLESKMLQLAPDREFVLSFHAKADAPIRLGAGLFCMNKELNNYANTGISAAVELTTEWKRYELAGKSVDAPGCLNCVSFLQPDLAQAATVWLDGIQLEEGKKASAFQPASPIEVGCASAAAGNIFFDTEPAAVELRFYNPGGASRSVLGFRIEDHWGRVVAEGTREITLSGKNHRENFALNTSARGIFRASFQADKSAPAEFVYSVLPPSASLDKRVPQGTVGMDSHFDNVKALKIFKRANIHWLHSKFLARWAKVEPEKGKFKFQDDVVRTAHEMGFSLILQILNEYPAPQGFLKDCIPGNGVNAAAWCQENPEKKEAYLKHFGEYVTALAQHYKPWVKHYEIDNEPNHNHYHRVIYPELLKRAYDALKKVDPEITVVGFAMGSYDKTCFPDWTAAGAMKSCDVASIHIYGGATDIGYSRSFAELLNQHSKPGWNTETGLSCVSFYRLPTYESTMQKDYWAEHDLNNRMQANIQTRNYLRCMAVKGMQRYIYYFARYTNAGPSQPTRWGGSCKEIGEFDGALRSAGVALALAGHQLDGATFVEQLNAHETVFGALFEREGKARGFFFKIDQSDDKGLALEFPADAVKGLRFFDLMGNPVGNGKPPAISATPVYFTADVPASKVKEWLATPLRAAGQ